MSERLSGRQRAVLVAAAVSSILAAIAGGIGVGIVGLVITIGVFVAGWRLVPGFWRTVLVGAAAGGLAGLLILGPGFRIAMRVVAILDSIRVPEFTVGGTLMIVVFVGLLAGAVFGSAGAMLRRATGISGLHMTVWMTVAIMTMLLSGRGIRAEFATLGAGPWVNIPMFSVVVVLYSWVANRLIERFSAKPGSAAALEPAEVQA